MFDRSFRLLSVCLVMLLTACGEADKAAVPLVLEPVGYEALPGWDADDHEAVLAAFTLSCERILKRDAADPFGPDKIGGTYGDWQPLCRPVVEGTVEDARAFFEDNFTPHAASFGGGEETGLFTGYYEAALDGSLTRGGPYQYPLHTRPDDLVMVDLGAFREDLRGRRIAGRVTDGRLRPYEDRAAITAGDWPHTGGEQVLVWVDDPVDAFFLHIQGSGRIKLDDGGEMRVGYAGQNGHVYYAIGRALIESGAVRREDMSMQAIRAWLDRNPHRAQELMNLNPSYVFFRRLDGPGPLGGEGVALTPERSLAIDRSLMPYGMPVWVDIAPPAEGAPALQRLMVAQDTGGAIRGAVRGDVFWGHGERAEYLAGKMKSEGRYWLLLPKTD